MNTPIRLMCAVSCALLTGAVTSQQSILKFLGQSPADQYGTSVSSAGDVNGDGFADVAVGVPGDDTAGIDAGSVQVLSGQDGSVLYSFFGDSAGDRLGRSVGGAGDVDGDGLADVVAGAPGDDNNGNASGSVRIFSGADGSILYLFNGDGQGDEMGGSVGGAGDVNGDGYADVIAGAPGDDNNGTNSGSARVYSGVDGAVLYTFDGDDAADRFGTAVAAAGRFDLDTFDDLAIGAPGDDDNGSNAGRVHVYSGATGTRLGAFDGGAAGDTLGSSVSGGGDVNGDGVDDVIAGAPNANLGGAGSGQVRVYLGPLGIVRFILQGEDAGDQFGFSVGIAGYVDGDDLADFIVGAPMGNGGVVDGGDARVFSGSTGALLYTIGSDTAGSAFGSSVDGAGDFDGDGFANLVIGVPMDDESAANAGAVRVVGQKPYDRLAELTTIKPAQPGANFGIAASLVGDVNMDGVDDYAVGAPWDLGTLGTVRVYSGADNSILHLLLGAALGINFGIRVGPAGDLDKDGFDDVIVGAIHDDTALPDAGAAFVYSGQDGSILLALYGDQNRSHGGSAVGTLGDVDGDTVNDYFFGLGIHNTEDGEVWVVSGATGNTIYTVPGPSDSWFGWSGAAIDDLDGDGITDFVVGAPDAIAGTAGSATVLSGADGTTIYTFNGLAAGDLFGWITRNAGDVNNDGLNDILVGGYQHDPAGRVAAGMVRVFSGADGSLLYHVNGQTAGDTFGRDGGGAGDVNGDGYGDFLVGAPEASPGGLAKAGSVYLYSGFDGSLLQQFDGATAGDGAGRSAFGLGDVNGDGYAEILVGSPYVDDPGADAGAVTVYETVARSDPGKFWAYGAGCPGSNGNLPGVGVSGRPVIGQSFTAELSTAATMAPAFLGLDLFQQNIPLDINGAPGCWLLALPLFALPSSTDALGNTGINLAIPANPAVVGASLYGQWIVIDPPANQAGFVTSNGGRYTLGQ